MKERRQMLSVFIQMFKYGELDMEKMDQLTCIIFRIRNGFE